MDKTNAVIVRIMDVHFAIAPALVGRFEINEQTLRLQFLMKFIDVLNPNKDDPARHAIAGKRGNVQFNLVTLQSHIARIGATERSISKSLRKTETVTVKLFRRG